MRFPEGNRTWDGVTAEFLPSIGKLARSSGASLVTYKLTGGYFASPRWAGQLHSPREDARRGRARILPRGAARDDPQEINERIVSDLHEDAYERQRKNPVRFEGKALAEHLERLLFLCPKCGRMHTLQSRDDTVRCWKCGFSFRYLPTGFLVGEDIPFDNLRDWTRWQKGEIVRLCDEAEDKPIFTDTDVRVDTVASGSGTKLLGRGDMRLFRGTLELPKAEIPVSEDHRRIAHGPAGPLHQCRRHALCHPEQHRSLHGKIPHGTLASQRRRALRRVK